MQSRGLTKSDNQWFLVENELLNIKLKRDKTIIHRQAILKAKSKSSDPIRKNRWLCYIVCPVNVAYNALKIACRGVRLSPLKKAYPRLRFTKYQIVASGETPVLKLWRMWRAFSLPLLQGSLGPGVVVPVRIPSMGQIDLFASYLL